MTTISEFAPGEWCFDDERNDDVIGELLDEACEALDAGELDAAADALRAILSRRPNHIDALHHLSIVHKIGC